MGSFSILHWVIVLAVVLLIFGTKRLRNVGQDLGEAIKGFKKGMREEDEKPVERLDDQSQSRSSETSASKQRDHDAS